MAAIPVVTQGALTIAGDYVGSQRAAAASDTLPNAGNARTLLHVDNGDASAMNVTITVTGASTVGKPATNIVVNVPGNERRMIGPFESNIFNDSNGEVGIAYDATTSVNVVGIRLP